MPRDERRESLLAAIPSARVVVAAMVALLPLRAAPAQPLVAVPTPALGAQCDDLDAWNLAAAIERELPFLRRMSPAQAYRFGDRTVTPAEYADGTLAPLLALAQQGTAALCAALPARFQFFRNAGVGAGKFTAYHNPVFRGSRTRTGPFQHALYRRPPGDLAKKPTAELLGAKLLDGKGLELVYLADATEVLSAHVEGSATIQLDDGSVMNVASDGQNGFPFVNPSKLLAEDKKIPKDQVTPIGMTRARKYFIDHPTELWGYWARNPRYVYFKESTQRGGGRFGELVPGRSLAIDVNATPLGLALFIRSDKPAIAGNKVTEWISFGRVALAQDTGSAITGPGRVDVFYGTGDYATAAAAVTTRPGEVYALLAR